VRFDKIAQRVQWNVCRKFYDVAIKLKFIYWRFSSSQKRKIFMTAIVVFHNVLFEWLSASLLTHIC